MKIIINHKGTKRVIDGSFAICGNNCDLEDIAHQILKAGNIGYGWIEIVDRPIPVPDTAPIDWKQAA